MAMVPPMLLAGGAAMGPVGWAMLGLSALSTLGSLSKSGSPNQTTFAPAANVGSKPLIQMSNPYQTPAATTGQDPYGRLYAPDKTPYSFASALGRYGGLQ